MLRERSLQPIRSARSSACLSRPLSGTRSPSSCSCELLPWQAPGPLPPRGLFSAVQAATGDDVVLVSSGVPGALVPLDVALVL